MNNYFLLELNSISDIDRLVAIRDQLVKQAAAPEVTWESRMMIYYKIQMIIQRIIQIESR